MDLPVVLKWLRTRKKLSQRELARSLKLSPSTVAMYETGQRTPDAETIMILADFFNTTTDFLLGRTDNPQPFTGSSLPPFPEKIRLFYDSIHNLSDESLKFLEKQAEYLKQLEQEIGKLKPK